MALMDKAVIEWQGLQGGNAVSVFYAAHGPFGVLNALRDFYNGIKAFIPGVVTIVFPTTGEVIESTTGQLDSEWGPVAQPANVVGTGSGGFASPSGASVKWVASGLADASRPHGGRHKVTGRTYIVPLDHSGFGGNGKIAPATVSVLQTAANNLVSFTQGNMLIWAPVVRNTDGSVFRPGSSHPVVGAVVKDNAAVLRGRRD